MNTKPISIIIAALGGEGGGVLSDWLIDAANAHDFPVQSTSVPGVAQRTGATTYYLEIFPVPRSELGGREPVLSLLPNPGDLDVIVASELVEAGRMIQNGFAHPARTTLVASTHREYAVAEKMAMGDGRFDADKVLAAAEKLAKQRVLFDMRALAWRHGTIINTVLFGAMVGAGALPVSREACEGAIRRSGKAVEASLRGFNAGYEYAANGVPAESGRDQDGAAWAIPSALAARVAALPPEVREIVAAGAAQVADYQSEAYAGLYLDRVEAVCRSELDAGGGPGGYAAAHETARYLALWMSYEDVIRVADLKTRRERLAKVRQEVGAGEDDLLAMTEYLKPGLEEICSVLPPKLAGIVERRFGHLGRRLNVGLHIRTHTVSGFLMLAGLRALRRWRPKSSRYALEQKAIGRWLAAVEAGVARSPALGLELALCGNLVKGYGSTHARGHKNLAAILEAFEQAGPDEAAQSMAAKVRQAREAALADPEGRKLAGALGLPLPEIKPQPLVFQPRKAVHPAQTKS